MQATCCIIFGHCVVSNEVIFGDFILFLLTKLEKKYEQVKNSFLHNKLCIGSFAHTLRFLCAYVSVFTRKASYLFSNSDTTCLYKHWNYPFRIIPVLRIKR